MNITDLIESYFSGEQAERLGQAVGMDGALAQKALAAGIPMQLRALADHATTAEGQGQLLEAMSSLPNFGSIASVLAASDGASNLQRAGELLAPVLLGGKAEEIVNGVTSQVGGSVGGIQKILQMALPLLLSLLGTQGLNAGNLSHTLEGLRGVGQASPGAGPASTGAVGLSPEPDTLGRAAALGAVGLGAAGLGAVGVGAAGLSAVGVGAGAGAGGPEGLLEQLKAQFSGATADRLGVAAGFNANAASRAVQGTLPIILNAVVNKGRTEAGAADLTRLSGPFGPLSDAQGLNAGLLNDSAELARIEGQGRGVLGSLFGNVNEITGRLGTALGGSGSSAARLLALMTPFVLSLLGRHTSGLTPSALSTMLGGLGGQLSSLLPAGMGGLAALLGAGTLASAGMPAGSAVAAPAVPAPPAPAPTPRTEETVVAKAAPASATTPTAAPPVAPTSTVTPPQRRGGFPWWLIPLLLLLLLGGCWVINRNNNAGTPTATSAGTNGSGIVVTNPASASTLPAAPFTMSGTAPAGTSLTIEDQGQQVATSTVGADGNWTADLPAPTAGEHTYTINGGDARSEFKVNITDAAAGAAGAAAGTAGTGSTGTGSADTGSTGNTATGNAATTPTTTPATGTTDSTGTGTAATPGTTTPAGTFAVTEPAANAALPAGGFTMRGTGKPGDQIQVFDGDTSLGTVTVAQDGTWSQEVPSPAAGAHTYTVKAADGTALGSLAATIGAASAGASAANCTSAYTLSMKDGQTISEPFNFGGKGKGTGYTVTVKRGERTVGTKAVALDSTCGWSYLSRPGKGQITYEVRPTGDTSATALSTINLTVR